MACTGVVAHFAHLRVMSSSPFCLPCVPASAPVLPSLCLLCALSIPFLLCSQLPSLYCPLFVPGVYDYVFFVTYYGSDIRLAVYSRSFTVYGFMVCWWHSDLSVGRMCTGAFYRLLAGCLLSGAWDVPCGLGIATLRTITANVERAGLAGPPRHYPAS